MRNGIRVGIVGLIVAAAITPGVAVAADFTVTTTADGDDKECVVDCTLREAVVLAGSADRVLVRSGNYVLEAGELSLNGDTIIGEDARKTFIDGGDKSRVLRVIETVARVSNVTIRNGNGVGLDPDGVGGGIFVHSGTLLLQNSTVSGNTGTMGAGIAASGVAQLIGVTVSGNTASTGRLTRGGGIATDESGGLLLGNSTVSGNTAVDETGSASQGGGVFSSGALAIIASTIANNSAAEGGGLYSIAPPTGAATSLQNSLISHGTGGACGGSGIDNLTATANVISDATCEFKDPSNLNNVNPQIGSLADNGGPTNTHALQPASPAIGRAASCATIDQRGFNRVAPCDSGAYEYRPPTLNVVMQVINDSGGNFNPSRFTVHVRSGGSDVSGSPQPGSASGTSYTLAAGSTYTVAADAVAGYALSSSGNCSVTLQEGQNATCTITADDIAPTLRVITNVVNNEGGTLGPASFTAHVRTGGFDVAGSPQPGSASGSTYTLSAGPTYTVSADVVAGYSLAVTGTCAANGNITLALGQNATCTITASDNPPTLRVITSVINDNGGTLAPGNLSAHVRAGATDVNGSPQPGTSTGTLYTLSAGVAYTVSADAVANYSLTVSGDCGANGTITLQLDQDRTCTITADDVAPTLRVVTTVINDSGGTRVPADFTAHVRSGGTDVSGSPQPGTGAGTVYTLAAGAYTVAADAVTGYTLSISGDCAANGTITLALGQARTCTITANDVAPTLRVITNVVNNNGGTAVASSFSAHVRQNGAEVPGSPQAGAGAPGTAYTLTPGTYAVTADGVPGYAATASGACTAAGSVTLALGQNATCTITVDDVAPTLRVITAVVNDNGGTAVASSFSAHVRQNGVEVAGSPQAGAGAPGTLYTLTAGTYAVTADGVSGYAATGSGACNAAGSVTLAAGQSVTCTITVDDVAPTLRVITNVVNDSGGNAVRGDFDAHVRRNGAEVTGSPQAGAAAPGTPYTLTPGTYAVTADGVSGYAATGSGACNAAGSVTLALGQTATCTITVDDVAPTLRVITNVVNDSGGSAQASDFLAHVRRNGVEVTGSPQAGAGAPGTLYTLTPGSYAVSADGEPGYAAAFSAACAGGTIVLALGETATCTITVDDIAATLRVITNVVNNHGGDAERSDFDAHVRRNGADVAGSPKPGAAAPGSEYTLAAGAYELSADGEPGYSATFSTDCAGGTIVLALGQTATCTITVDDVAPTLRVITNVVNDSGGNAERGDFDAHVTRNGADVAGSPQPGAAAPGSEYTLTPGSYAVTADGVAGYSATFSAPCAGGTIVLALGQTATCTIIVDDIAPTLRVITNVVNNHGGSAVRGDFDAHVRRNGADVTDSPQAGAAAPGTLYTLTPGTYAVTADGVPGYAPEASGACDAAGSVTLALGESVTCTVTVDDVPATLRVITNVVNDGGGDAERDDFDVHVERNGADVAGSPKLGAAAPGSEYTLAAGAYELSADGEPGYAATFSTACAGGTIALTLGQTATCTITLDDIAPTLRVITNVVNDSGGNAVRGDFDAHVRRNGAQVTDSPQPGAAAPGTLYTLTPGTYAVTADGVPGYAPEGSGACNAAGSVTLALGESVTCTITVDDVAPTLRVITTVVNDSGGEAERGDFDAHVRRNGAHVTDSPQPGAAAPGTLYTLTPGTYAVTADGVPGYAPEGSGACDAAGSVTLALGENATCTITVDDIPATLRVITNVVNNHGGGAERDDFDVHVMSNGSDVTGSPRPGADDPGTGYTLAAGTYELSAEGESGYAASFSPECEGGTAVLALAQTATCTITLEDGAGTLNVMTEVVNDDGGTADADAFDVSVRLAGADVPTSPQPGSETGTPYALPAATYTVTADGVPGYTYSVTGDCEADGSIALPLRETRDCTVTANDVAPKLTVVTRVVNDHGGSAAPSGFTVHVRRGGADVGGSPQPGSASGTVYTLDAGAHVVAADAVPGYGSAISGHCAGNGSITLAVGDVRTCTVTANDNPPPPVRAQGSQQLPPPEPGENVNAVPESGTVKVKLPGSARYVDLDEAQQLPVGTVIDATKGHVTLIAAANDSGGTATAEFWAGIFKLGQTKGRSPTTILTLVEKLSCPRAGKASAAARKKKKRRLWGNGSGKFRTKGKHSAATVVGTRWLVEDRCRSTLTRVVRGRVSVRDFAKKKTVIVRAGKKYVAKAKQR